MTAVDLQQVHPWTPLFHWSPRANRESIREHGLRIRQPSPQGADLRMPFVAFGLDPAGAWQMSGDVFRTARSWDLWQVHYDDLRGAIEVIPFDDMSPREVRAYRSVPDVTYIATRSIR